MAFISRVVTSLDDDALLAFERIVNTWPKRVVLGDKAQQNIQKTSAGRMVLTLVEGAAPRCILFGEWGHRCRGAAAAALFAY